MKIKDPLISIIIPTLNRADMISGTLNSLLAQSYEKWECIIVDDGSNDGTDVMLAQYNEHDRRIKYFRRPEGLEKGPGSCRNYGFSKCKGDLVHFMDSDDEYYPDALKTYLEYMSGGADVSLAEIEFVDQGTNRIIKRSNIFSPNLVKDYLQGKISFYVSGPIWKREFLSRQKDLFDPKIRNLDDWDFNLRMLYDQPCVNFINKPLIKYNIHGHSLSAGISQLLFCELKSEFRARRKHIRLLKNNHQGDPQLIKIYIKNRYKFIVREAFAQKKDFRFYFLRKLLFIQLDLKDFKGFQRSVCAYFSYMIFNKGYKFIK